MLLTLTGSDFNRPPDAPPAQLLSHVPRPKGHDGGRSATPNGGRRGPSTRGKLAASTTSDQQEQTVQQIALALPILPGKTQQTRHFMEQLEGPRRAEYERADREIGVVQETWFLQPADGDGGADSLIMYLTSEDLADTFGKFIATKDGVLAYFKDQLLEVTGQDWNVPPTGPLPEVLSHLELNGA